MSEDLGQGIFLALMIGVGVILLNLFLFWISRRIQVKLVQDTLQSIFLKLVLRILTLLIQITITLFCVYVMIDQIPIWRPWLYSLLQEIVSVLRGLNYFISQPIITIPNNKTPDKPTEFSIGSILQILILGTLLIIWGRSFRNWLKKRVLTRLGLDKGNQETISSVVFYITIFLGFVILLQTVGLDLSSLTVVAGVLGIGIGFGLQNLASNFISGVTILIEQPIKVGDFVEVNGLLGTVERISVRATIIETQDGISIIVPNSKFIENNVVNWSYGDPSSRVHLPVQVAYETDLTLATEALLNAARSDNKVMAEPAPQVILKKFGENGFDLELLVWIEKPQLIEPIRSNLNYRIEEEFRRLNIQIPFTQRDIYIRSFGNLEQLLPPLVAKDELTNIPIRRTLKDLFRQISFFKNCSDVEIRTLVEGGYRQTFTSGTVICRQGEPGNAFYIILEGTIGVIAEPSGQVLAELSSGNFCGEIAVLTGTNRTATLTALVDTLLFIVDRKALRVLLNQNQNLAEEISNTLALRTQELKELGLLPDDEAMRRDRVDPVTLIRNRLKQLFGLDELKK